MRDGFLELMASRIPFWRVPVAWILKKKHVGELCAYIWSLICMAQKSGSFFFESRVGCKKGRSLPGHIAFVWAIMK